MKKIALKCVLVSLGLLAIPQVLIGIFFTWAISYLPESASTLRYIHVCMSGVILLFSTVGSWIWIDFELLDQKMMRRRP